MAGGTFGTVINCMDGRTQEPANRFLRDRFAVDFVDVITEAGPIRILSEGYPEDVLAGIRARLEISIEGHGSGQLAIVAHEDCAGNPVDKDVQMIQLKKSQAVVKDWFPGVDVIGLWIEPVDGVWVVGEVG